MKYIKGYEPFDFQKNNIEKCINICKLDGGCLIADETGLGKTITALYTLKAISDGGNTLIIAPVSTIAGWKHYIETFGLKNVDVCTYKKPHTDKNYSCLILDEAHRCIEVSTATYLRIFKIIRGSRQANGFMPYVMLLSATPVQNSIKEFKNLIGLIPFRCDSVGYV